MICEICGAKVTGLDNKISANEFVKTMEGNEMLEALETVVEFFQANYPKGEISWLPSLEFALKKARGES